MSYTTDRAGLAIPTAEEAAAVDALLAKRGLAATQAILGLGRHTIQRIRGGLPVRRPTLVQARMMLEMIAGREAR